MTTQTSPPRSLLEGLRALRRLEDLVKTSGACALPGVSLRPEVILPAMWRAVERGFVESHDAEFVSKGLTHGFDAGIDVSRLRGRQRFRNYPAALENRAAVSRALRARVSGNKTVCLGRFRVADRDQLPWPDWRIFPQGAVPKALEDAMRVTSDHSRTGVNFATDTDALSFSITVYKDLERMLTYGSVLRVSDVEGAFPLLPLAPHLWPFFLLHWYDLDYPDDDPHAPWCLYVHVCGDFGAAGMPGCWHIFFEKVILATARSEGILVSPMAVCVDDTGLVGAPGSHTATDEEGYRLSAWMATCGVFSKDLKVRAASSVAHMVGFWWDTFARTRTLDERRLKAYVDMLVDFSARRSLTLRETQQIAGRMQRGVMTLPPGAACLLSNLYALMRGLSRPWQKRRTTRPLRDDLADMARLLDLNMGQGYFSTDRFGAAPAVHTDASKSHGYTGGGYVSRCGRYRYWTYSPSAARKPIDFLEGDVVVEAVRDLGPRWSHKVVRFSIDNQAFQRSAVKGWSHAGRLSTLIRELFYLSLRFGCILEFEWISTLDNVYADALSREGGHPRFLALIQAHRFLLPGAVLLRDPRSGTARRLGREYSSDEAGDGPAAALNLQTTVPYTRASIWQGLPSEAVSNSIESMMDHRLAASSIRSVSAALGHWDVVAARHGWPRIIVSDDLSRGGKLATLVIYMVEETDLVASSIANYVWAFRSWLKFQRQLDPVYGIPEWPDFMQSVAVVAWVASEPRKEVPLDMLRSAIQACDTTCFWQVQTVVLVLFLMLTFARSETPCPGALSGPNALDETKHLLVRDVKPKAQPSFHAAMRLKAIKQDPRLERPEAAGGVEGGEDWILVGDVDDPDFSVAAWLRLLFSFHSSARAPDSAFFLADNRRDPLVYRKAMQNFRLLLRAGGATDDEARSLGLHGLRVLGYNLAKRVDQSLAVAHGGWMSSAHERYERFSLDSVLSLPERMLAVGTAAGAAHPPSEQPAAHALPTPAAHAAPTAPAAPPPRAERPLSGPSGPRLGVARRVPALVRGAGSLIASPSRPPSAVPRPSPPRPAPFPEPDPRPLTRANAVDRHVLVPASLWPSWVCMEMDGRGWRARVLSVTTGGAKLAFVQARTARGREFAPVELQLDVLQPL